MVVATNSGKVAPSPWPASKSGELAKLHLPSAWKVVDMISFDLCWEGEERRSDREEIDNKG
jgi:hypothetical protein